MSGPGTIGNRTNTAHLDRMLAGTGLAAKPTVAAQTGALGNRTVAVAPAPQPRAAEPGFFGRLWISIKNFFGVGQGTPVVVAPAPQRAPTTANATAPQPTGPQTLGGNQAVVKKPPLLFSARDPALQKEQVNAVIAELYKQPNDGARLAGLINKASARTDYPSRQHLEARNFQSHSMRESQNPVFSKINDLVISMIPANTPNSLFSRWTKDNADLIRDTIENQMENMIEDIVKDTENAKIGNKIGNMINDTVKDTENVKNEKPDIKQLIDDFKDRNVTETFTYHDKVHIKEGGVKSIAINQVNRGRNEVQPLNKNQHVIQGLTRTAHQLQSGIGVSSNDIKDKIFRQTAENSEKSFDIGRKQELNIPEASEDDESDTANKPKA